MKHELMDESTDQYGWTDRRDCRNSDVDLVTNEFDPPFEGQGSGNKAFKKPVASFPNGSF